MKPTMHIVVLGMTLAAFSPAVGQTATRTPRYDVNAEVAMTGKVTKLTTVPDWMGKDGVNIALQVSEVAPPAPHIDVATAAFLERFGFPIAIGDELRLKGCWSESADGSAVFLVHELTNRKVTLNVRDPGGRPLW